MDKKNIHLDGRKVMLVIIKNASESQLTLLKRRFGAPREHNIGVCNQAGEPDHVDELKKKIAAMTNAVEMERKRCKEIQEAMEAENKKYSLLTVPPEELSMGQLAESIQLLVEMREKVENRLDQIEKKLAVSNRSPFDHGAGPSS